MKIYLVILNSFNDGEYEDYEHSKVVISAHTSKEKALDVIKSYEFDNVETDNINEENGVREVVTHGTCWSIETHWTHELYYKEMEIDHKYFIK